jgi:NTP pyrophosphatase (non-canonical NTP hydrolase)
MRFSEYQELAARTANSAQDKRRIVACLGLAGEAGEFVDAIKKMVAHGHDVPEEQLKKELGDVLWYVAELCSAFGWSLEEVAAANIDKLRQRYPEGFSSAASVARADVQAAKVEQ